MFRQKKCHNYVTICSQLRALRRLTECSLSRVVVGWLILSYLTSEKSQVLISALRSPFLTEVNPSSRKRTRLTSEVDSFRTFSSLSLTNRPCAWFEASAAVSLRHLIFWNVTRRLLVVSYRRFGKINVFWLLKMGTIGCPKTSVTNYQYTLCDAQASEGLNSVICHWG